MAGSGRIKLLVVDDVPENVVVLEALLARPDVQLLTADSGPRALELLLEHDVALALLDVQMPGMDGFELAELMRGTERTRKVPIIFVTAGSRDHNRTFRGYEAGAVDFLYKPLDAHVLLSKVDVFIELHRQRQQLAQQLDALRDALRVNELFAAVLGHDLRNPLGAILNNAAVLRRLAKGDPDLVGVADRIQQSGHRMSRMITQLLDLSRLRHRGLAGLAPAPTDLVRLCRSVLDELEGGAARRRVEMRVDGDGAGCWDPDRLEQVFSNLLANALRHSPPATPVTLTIDGRAQARVRVQVANAGVIAPELLPHLFEPFRSGRPAGRGDGLGLGLYIVHQIVEAHDGRIVVRSDVEAGTVFELDLPRHVESADPATAGDGR